jgi:hypothetical protein
LSIIGRIIQNFYPHTNSKLIKFSRCKHSTLIGSDSLRNTKSVNNILFYKIDHTSRCYPSQRNCFNPFCEIIGSNKYKFMSFAQWRLNLTDEIDSPSPERPRFNYRIHGR